MKLLLELQTSVGTIERLNCSRRRFLSEKDRGVVSASSNCASLRVSQPPLVLCIYRFNQRPSTDSNSSSSTQIVDSLEFSFSFCPFCPRHHDIIGSSTRTRGFFFLFADMKESSVRCWSALCTLGRGSLIFFSFLKLMMREVVAGVIFGIVSCLSWSMDQPEWCNHISTVLAEKKASREAGSWICPAHASSRWQEKPRSDTAKHSSEIISSSRRLKKTTYKLKWITLSTSV
jgi:hypothetical protein